MKRFLALFLIIAAVIVASFILQDSLGRQIIFGFTDVLNTRLFVEKPPPFTQNSEGEESLTGIFISKIIEHLGLKDPEKAEAPLNFDPTEINEWLAAEIKNFDLGTLKPEVPDGALVIGQDQSAGAVLDYLNGLQKILDDNFSTLPWGPDFNFETASVTEALQVLNRYIFQYEQALNGLYNLKVPRNLVDFHKKEIGLVSAQANVYKALRDYEQDPLKTLVIASASKKISQEFAALQEELGNFLTRQNINFP